MWTGALPPLPSFSSWKLVGFGYRNSFPEGHLAVGGGWNLEGMHSQFHRQCLHALAAWCVGLAGAVFIRHEVGNTRGECDGSIFMSWHTWSMCVSSHSLFMNPGQWVRHTHTTSAGLYHLSVAVCALGKVPRAPSLSQQLLLAISSVSTVSKPGYTHSCLNCRIFLYPIPPHGPMCIN